MKLDEVVLGDKAAKEIRVGFILRYTPAVPLPQTIVLEPGREGLFFLKKHHEEAFYVNFALSGGIPRDVPGFDKNLETARKMAKILQVPAAALKVDNASDRFLAVAMLIQNYRPLGLKEQQRQEEPIDAEVSKLLLRALAEADWEYDTDRLEGLYPPHPYRLFQQLGVTKADGYDPPTHDLRNTFAATRKWLQDHQEKYSVKRFTPRSRPSE